MRALAIRRTPTAAIQGRYVLKVAKPVNMTDHVREVVASDINDGRLLPGVYRQNLFARTARIAVSHQDHGRVLSAIEEGDAEGALKHMLDHIGVGGRDFTEYLSTSATGMFNSATHSERAGVSGRRLQTSNTWWPLRGHLAGTVIA